MAFLGFGYSILLGSGYLLHSIISRIVSENNRISTALNCVTTNVMIADKNFNICYMNKSLHNMFSQNLEQMREDIPEFDLNTIIGTNIDAFHKNPGHQRGILERMTKTVTGNIKIADRAFTLVINAVVDENGNRDGTVVEWTDTTDTIRREDRVSQLTTAMDVIETNVMIADNNLDIIYMNSAMQRMFRRAEADIQKGLPGFKVSELIGANIGAFHKHPAHQRGILTNLTTTHKSTIHIAGLTFTLSVTPIFNSQRERIGTAVEWANRTEEIQLENAVSDILEQAAKGNLANRLDTYELSGFFAKISGYINELLVVTAKSCL